MTSLYVLSFVLLFLYTKILKKRPLVGNMLVALFCAGLGGLGSILGSALGGSHGGGLGGLGSLLDMNGNGNPLDDILGMTGKLMP